MQHFDLRSIGAFGALSLAATSAFAAPCDHKNSCTAVNTAHGTVTVVAPSSTTIVITSTDGACVSGTGACITSSSSTGANGLVSANGIQTTAGPGSLGSTAIPMQGTLTRVTVGGGANAGSGCVTITSGSGCAGSDLSSRAAAASCDLGYGAALAPRATLATGSSALGHGIAVASVGSIASGSSSIAPRNALASASPVAQSAPPAATGPGETGPGDAPPSRVRGLLARVRGSSPAIAPPSGVPAPPTPPRIGSEVESDPEMAAPGAAPCPPCPGAAPCAPCAPCPPCPGAAPCAPCPAADADEPDDEESGSDELANQFESMDSDADFSQLASVPEFAAFEGFDWSAMSDETREALEDARREVEDAQREVEDARNEAEESLREARDEADEQIRESNEQMQEEQQDLRTEWQEKAREYRDRAREAARSDDVGAREEARTWMKQSEEAQAHLHQKITELQSRNAAMVDNINSELAAKTKVQADARAAQHARAPSMQPRIARATKSKDKHAKKDDGGLEERIVRLERIAEERHPGAAREDDGSRSLEERVADLEKLLTERAAVDRARAGALDQRDVAADALRKALEASKSTLQALPHLQLEKLNALRKLEAPKAKTSSPRAFFVLPDGQVRAQPMVPAAPGSGTFFRFTTPGGTPPATTWTGPSKDKAPDREAMQRELGDRMQELRKQMDELRERMQTLRGEIERRPARASR